MKKITVLTVFLACAFLSTPASAQTPAPAAAPNWSIASVTFGAFTRDDVESSRFQEYRVMPKGFLMTDFSFAGSQDGRRYALFAKDPGQVDQRFTGYYKANWGSLTFDYNAIPHQLGNHGHTFESEVAPGVWAMSTTIRQALQTAVDSRMPTSTRTYLFYQSLFTPMISASNVVDITAQRNHGNYELDLSGSLPISLKLSYERDLKKGYRGSGAGVIYSAVNSIMELPEPLDELTQDAGLRATLNRDWGAIYAAYGHNWYNNRIESTLFDNPLRASDQAYTAAVGTTAPPLGGPGSARVIGPPDNDADRGSIGFFLKLKKQTRFTGDISIGQWNQNAAFFPYTTNTTVLTAANVNASTTAAMPKASLDGKIKTTSLNFGFSSRPVDGLGIRLRYRSFDMDNQTPTFIRAGYVLADRSWASTTATAAVPFGYETANPYGSKTTKFDAQVSYDLKVLTVEGAFRNSQITRTYREATKGAETGATIAAIMRMDDWLMFRGSFDKAKRTASGYDAATSIGLQADESERETTRVGFDVELTPVDQLALTFAYGRHNSDYPNRPNRSAVAAGTINGLLNTKYDTYTVEADFTPMDRANLGFFYTYEKDFSRTQTGGTGTVAATALAALLTFDGSAKGNTYGAFANFVLVPEKLTFDFNAKRAKVDGLMDITGDPTGPFALARVAYGGIQDITDYNDTDWTTMTAQFKYTFNKDWSLNLGWMYDKYKIADAYSIFGNQQGAGLFDYGNEIFPESGGFYLKANDGDYKANIFFIKLNKKF